MSAGAGERSTEADLGGERAEPLAPWAFRAAMAGLSEEQARELLEGERCPQPTHDDRWEDETDVVELREEADSAVVYRTDEEHAWIQSDTSLTLDEIR
jgi:hypothetical protein